MNTFTEWCAHYDYDPSSEAAKADYAKYQEQLNFFQQLDEPCFLEDEGPSDDLPQPPHRTVMYHIANDRGYWLPKGYGYTKSLTEAGRFTVADMAAHNLDGCTLYRVQD